MQMNARLNVHTLYLTVNVCKETWANIMTMWYVCQVTLKRSCDSLREALSELHQRPVEFSWLPDRRAVCSSSRSNVCFYDDFASCHLRIVSDTVFQNFVNICPQTAPHAWRVGGHQVVIPRIAAGLVFCCAWWRIVAGVFNQSISMNLLWRPTSKALGRQKYSENTTA